ncbi:MAG: M13 family metallopeptidase [Pseudomonadota bacterium]
MRHIAFAATLALVAACSQESTEQTAPEQSAAAVAPKSGILLDNMQTDVHPGDDFFAYVNGTWIETTEIPADKPSYGNFTVLREESQANVRTIIEESAEGDFPKGSDEQKVGDLYTSYMNMERRDELGTAPLADEFAAIDAIEDTTGLAVYMADANKQGIGLPFIVGQYADFKDPNTYMIYTYQSGLGLPDREYYFDENEKFVAIRAAYQEHIEAMLNLAGVEAAAEATATIYELEERMAAEHMKKEKTRDMVALYNKVPLAELPQLMPRFAWTAFLQEARIAGIDGLVVTQLDYMRALDGIFMETPIDDWKAYLKWRVVDAKATHLNAAVDQQNFEFRSRTLLGVEEPQPRWRRAVNVVNGNLGEVVGKVYVKRHFPPAAKAKMQELVANLTKAYELSINELTWMGEETKAEALDKLSKFTPKVGYPDEWKDYSSLEIDADDLYGNMKRAALRRYEEQIERQSGPVDRNEWAMTPQTVNAYYNPPLNEIVFPAGILQPPFFDLTADDAVNYGAIGAVIGHEIGHGFDDSGSTFDGNGVLRNWWTDDDRTEFKRRTQKLIDQYSAFKPFPDLAVNGEFTLGENIGDLGGLSIGLLAYQLSLDGEEAPVIDGFTGIQRVFLGYGQVWRKKYREEALRNQIGTDPHSPSMYRTNGVVRNVPEFYEAFNVDEQHALFLPTEDRVKIW